MKRLIAALIVGLAIGYHVGFDDADQGRESIVTRTLDRFGTSKLRRAQTEHDRRVDEASRP
jgi:hypothetical protein